MIYRYFVKVRDNEGDGDWDVAGEWDNIDHAKSDWDDKYDVIVNDILQDNIYFRLQGRWRMFSLREFEENRYHLFVDWDAVDAYQMDKHQKSFNHLTGIKSNENEHDKR